MLFKQQSQGDESGLGFSARASSQIEDGIALRLRIHERLLDLLNLSVLEKTPRESLRAEIRTVVGQLLQQEKRLLTPSQTEQLTEDVLDELLGLGPLEPLLKDETVNDILINTHNSVYVERNGRLEKTDVHFQDTRHLIRIINKIVAAVGRRVDESQPMVDARLADGSRVNAVIPPLAVDGPLVSIRKFAAVPIHMGRLVELNSASPEIAQLLQAIVKCRRNVLISGGTGSGKTTLLNALSAFIDNRERIVTIEDSAELQLQQPHVCRLETRPENIEGKGEVTQRELVKNSLRMRPDRIILGEIRGAECFDLLAAMNTGHDGSMCTLHANSPRECLGRMENMILMGDIKIPKEAISRQIAESVDLIVQVKRLRDGSRRTTNITEVIGMEGDVIVTQELFKFEYLDETEDGKIIGEFRPSGLRPYTLEKARQFGFDQAFLEACL